MRLLSVKTDQNGISFFFNFTISTLNSESRPFFKNMAKNQNLKKSNTALSRCPKMHMYERA